MGRENSVTGGRFSNSATISLPSINTLQNIGNLERTNARYSGSTPMGGPPTSKLLAAVRRRPKMPSVETFVFLSTLSCQEH